jgi:hypothetical protein
MSPSVSLHTWRTFIGFLKKAPQDTKWIPPVTRPPPRTARAACGLWIMLGASTRSGSCPWSSRRRWRRHTSAACRRLAQHVEIVGGLLRELELAELMRREATRWPLEQLRPPRRAVVMLRARHDVPGLRVPPEPARRRPDGRGLSRGGAGDRHIILSCTNLCPSGLVDLLETATS